LQLGGTRIAHPSTSEEGMSCVSTSAILRT
jgi:hypothetical protein